MGLNGRQLDDVRAVLEAAYPSKRLINPWHVGWRIALENLYLCALVRLAHLIEKRRS